jgi:glutaredoxin-like YruB-family protein
MDAKKVVKVYSTTTCPWCAKVKSFLDQNGVRYQDLDVAKDKQARDEMIKKSGQMGVPVIEIDGDIVIGFNQQQLKEKLGI